jgi:hypothetical protein
MLSTELIGELYQRYMRSELSLDDASEQIFGSFGAAGRVPPA